MCVINDFKQSLLKYIGPAVNLKSEDLTSFEEVVTDVSFQID